jgi:uncharacterized protein (DUF2062 family)
LHIDDSPNRIALGVAVGLFVAWTPAIGLHILITLALAAVTGANKFVALTCVWISNVFTAVFIYYPNYLVGWFILSRFNNKQALEQDEVITMFKDVFAFDNIATCLYQTEFWQKLLALLMKIGTELWVGGLIVGSIISVTGYIVFYNLINWYRKKHPHRQPTKA